MITKSLVKRTILVLASFVALILTFQAKSKQKPFIIEGACLAARPTPDAIWPAADAFSALALHGLFQSLAFPAENSKGGLAHKAFQIASARASDDEGIRC